MMTRRSKIATVALGAMAALMIAGCGERPQVINYKQGKYQGKPDQPPYAAAPFNGDQAKWDRDIRTRTQGQNEYKRIGS
jgi:ABC-type nitrate/sulfonate/bicarbonate transport system substrate-binding protein